MVIPRTTAAGWRLVFGLLLNSGLYSRGRSGSTSMRIWIRLLNFMLIRILYFSRRCGSGSPFSKSQKDKVRAAFETVTLDGSACELHKVW
jgi:hypothetical protein